MSCVNINGGFFCSSRVAHYTFDGCSFEFSDMFGPHPINKDGELSKRNPGRKFWKMWGKWEKLTKDEKEAHRI